jgi:hypothetical protein
MGAPAVRSEDDLLDEMERTQIEARTAEARRDIDDPLWREKQQMANWREAQTGAAGDLYREQSGIRKEIYNRNRASLQQKLNALHSDPRWLTTPKEEQDIKEQQVVSDAQEELNYSLGIPTSGSYSSTPRVSNMPSNITR